MKLIRIKMGRIKYRIFLRGSASGEFGVSEGLVKNRTRNGEFNL